MDTLSLDRVLVRNILEHAHDYTWMMQDIGLLGLRLDEQRVADIGLLGGSESEPGLLRGRGVSVAAMSAGGGGSSVPSLDPVPQKIVAGIEARFRITPVALPSST